MTLEQLKAEEDNLREKLKFNILKQRELNLSEWRNEYGISEGDIVEFLDCGEIKRGKIEAIQYSGAKVSSFQKVRLFKKNGSLGDRVVNVFTKMTKSNDQKTGNK